jgi:hypothetical protein
MLGRIGRLVVLAGVIAGLPATAFAAVDEHVPAGTARPAAVAGLDSSLSAVARSAQRDGQATALGVARTADLTVVDDEVHVIAEAADGSEAAESAIRAVGGEVQGSAGSLVEAQVPVGALARLGHAPAITLLRRPALFAAQSLTTEGLQASEASFLQTAGVLGSGVDIAIIDIGFGGLSDAQSAGDLPAGVDTQNLCGSAIDANPHGTAVAEIVHQMAPAATLHLICVDSEVDLTTAETYAASHGVDVINHSVGWFNTSRGDGSGGSGSPDAAVAKARQDGILWVNAAGNEAMHHWSGTFQSNEGTEANQFGPSDDGNTISVATGEQVCGTLKWDAWPVTSQDFDLYLVRSSDDAVVAASVVDQSVGPAAPTEALCWTNPGGATSVGWAIVRYSATTTPRMDLFSLSLGSLQYAVADGSVVEPASSPQALAVGASCSLQAGVSPVAGTSEPFSSRGTTTDGRPKPDLVAPDAVSNPVYGAANGCTDGFTGTSASAAHVAGAAALLRQQLGAGTTAQDLTNGLESTALERGVVGFDGTFGAGALHLLPSTPQPRIVYNRSVNGIFVVNGDGSDLRTIVRQADDDGPTEGSRISPDGSQVIFARHPFSSAAAQLMTVNLATGVLSPLTPMTGASDTDPSFSSDGTRVVFIRNRQVAVRAADGTVTVLTSGDGVRSSPAFSPDGSRIVFSLADPWGGSQLEVMNADGTNRSTLVGLAGSGSNTSPAWSPDGARIAWMQSGGDSDGLRVMNADGTGARTVTTNAWSGPSFSPDGAQLGYYALTPTRGFYSIGVDGTGAHLVLAGQNGDGPRWGTSEPTTPVNAAAPTITGKSVVGQPLAAAPGVWAPRIPLALSSVWQRCNASGTACTDLSAFAASYVPVAADVGSTLRIRVSTGAVSATSAPTPVVAIAAPVNTTLPTISGTATPGQTLTAGVGGWNGSPSDYMVRWRLCGPDGGPCVDIQGATGTTHVLSGCEAGLTVRATVLAVNGGGVGAAASRPTLVGAGGTCGGSTPGGGGGSTGGGGGGGGGGTTTTGTAITPAPGVTPADTPSVTPTPSPPATTPVATPAPPAVSRTQLASVLSTPVPTRAELLHLGSFGVAFSAPVPGVLRIQWTALAAGKGARAAAAITVATGTRSFNAAGKGRVTVRLTAAGRRLLRGKHSVRIRTVATFTPRSGAPVSTSRTRRVA